MLSCSSTFTSLLIVWNENMLNKTVTSVWRWSSAYWNIWIQCYSLNCNLKIDLNVSLLSIIFCYFQKQLFLTDMKLVDEALYSHASTQSIQEQKSFYDLLHFSPLKIHVSFTMASGSTHGQQIEAPNFLNVLLQGLGVTLTDLQDVVFK